VFDRYFTAANRTAESTGLGLAIIKKIMDLHDEKVVAEVNDGVTTFRFTLSIFEK
jgi:signal transduction histidine kinase